MYKIRLQDAHRHHVGFFFLILTGACLAAERRYHKMSDDGARSGEPSSDEGQLPFSSEFGEFFEGGQQKESGERFGFPEDFNPEFIPYSESRNTTRYVRPASTYHSVKDMPSHSRTDDEPKYRSREPSLRKGYGDSRMYRTEGSYKEDLPYSKEGKYKNEDYDSLYFNDRSYKKPDITRKPGTYGSKQGPKYRIDESTYRKGSYPHKRGGDHRKHVERPVPRSRLSHESRHRKEGGSYRNDETYQPLNRREELRGRKYNTKRPVQYDDWSPEEVKLNDKDQSRAELEHSSEYDESDYRERYNVNPPPHPSSLPRHSEKGQRSDSIPTSMRPGPPYYSTPLHRQAETHKKIYPTSYGKKQDYPKSESLQDYYTAPKNLRKQEISRDLLHKKGEVAPSPWTHKERSDFRPSLPDPLRSIRLQDDFPQTEYSNPVPKKVITSTRKPRSMQNCVKLQKKITPEVGAKRTVQKMMTCYVCRDIKSNMNYEECSYESDLMKNPFVKSSGQQEAFKSKVTHRDKRNVATIEDPQMAVPTPAAERSKREKDYYDSSKEEHESEESKQENDASSSKDEDPNSENCHKKRKGEMLCVVCLTANKQGSYEECSYASHPSKNKYEHSIEKVYGSPRLPISNKDKAYGSKEDEYDDSENSKDDYPAGDYDSASDGGNGKKGNRDTFSFGNFGENFESFFRDTSGEGFDFDSIPEPAETEGQFSTKDETFNFKPDVMDTMTKNLGDFVQKNRSSCKKVMKNKMTCYQCVNDEGIKNEECMFVAAAEPKSKHLSFTQVQEYRSDPEHKPISSKDTAVNSTSPIHDKRKLKKYHPDLVDMKYLTKLKDYFPLKTSRRPRSPGTNKNTTNSWDHTTGTIKEDQTGEASDTTPTQRILDEVEQESEEIDEETDGEQDADKEFGPAPTEPSDIDLTEAEKGEYHEDTMPAWDPHLGISLPRYMLERSEHEAVFDEILASG